MTIARLLLGLALALGGCAVLTSPAFEATAPKILHDKLELVDELADAGGAYGRR